MLDVWAIRGKLIYGGPDDDESDVAVRSVLQTSAATVLRQVETLSPGWLAMDKSVASIPHGYIAKNGDSLVCSE